MVTRYFIGVLVISFAIGVGAAVGVFVAIGVAIPLGQTSLVDRHSTSTTELKGQIGNLTEKLTAIQQQLNAMSAMNSSIDKIQSGTQGQFDKFDHDITVIEADVKRLSNQIDDLKAKVDKLTVGTSMLSADLNKSKYNAGDSAMITGTGLSNAQVTITLLDSEGLILSQGSTQSDSVGKFVFTIQLSKSLAPGDYTVKVSQGEKTMERALSIVSGTNIVPQPQPQTPTTLGLTLTLDKTQYAIGDNALISGKTNSSTWVVMSIFNPDNVEVVRTTTKSDINGNYQLQYTISQNFVLGKYTIKAMAGTQEASATFTVVQSSPSTSTTSGNDVIKTDKSSYSKGNIVRITGVTTPNTKIDIEVKPPYGDTALLVVTTDSNGNYVTFYLIKPDAVSGTWTLTAKLNSNGTIIGTAEMAVG